MKKGYYYFIQSGSNVVPYNSLNNNPDHLVCSQLYTLGTLFLHFSQTGISRTF